MDKKYTGKAYVIGGVPYKLAKQSRTGKERYTTLSKLESYKPKNEKEAGGLKILQGIYEGCGTPDMIFDWDANFTIGFLIKMPY